MDLITKKDFKKLTKPQKETPCISILIRTIKKGEETRKNKIKFKNSLNKAVELLKKEGLAEKDARDILEEGYKLVEDNSFWQYQDNGLVVYISRSLFVSYRIPITLKEAVILGDRFHVKPLIEMLSRDTLFYILALSIDKAKLYRCTRQDISEIKPEGMPKSLSQALKYEEPEKELQYHTKTASGSDRGDRPAVFHGQGLPDDHEKNKIKRYFGKIDGALQTYFEIEKPPLVIASVDFLFPIFKEANSYNRLVENPISGNPENKEVTELHKQALEIINPLFDKERKEALENFKNQEAQDQTVKKLEDVVRQAHLGKISTLFVAKNEEKWGVYNPNTDVLQSHSKQKPESIDLLDVSASQVILSGGRVFVLEEDNIPSDTGIAGILRY